MFQASRFNNKKKYPKVADPLNHGDLVFKLPEAGVGGLILKVFQNFLSSRTQRVNPLWPKVLNIGRLTKISILF